MRSGPLRDAGRHIGRDTPEEQRRQPVAAAPVGGRQPVRTTAVAQSGNGALSYFKGPWKLIAGSGSGGSLNPYGIPDRLPEYDKSSYLAQRATVQHMASDPEERYDMATRQPRLVQEMLEALAVK